ncbi:MAG: M20/M25/M40 family metallo-hydrolase [Prevotellaceae bacterium]|jgi:acetylornithine deacetylase|nr:M20/M25/M40 family metallo-hydrolase [Prevotellaceae bacterium]
MNPPSISDTVELLRQLIATPSFSGEEQNTAALIRRFLERHGTRPQQYLNNVTATGKHYSPDKPVLLLNSHHDTVRPSSAYTRNPFEPALIDGKLYGLGSNDAGGALVALAHTFCHFFDRELPFNIVYAATAEEEAICRNGISALWPKLGRVDFAIVGEPTGMQAAIAERGLIVLDCLAEGRAGHAARNEGENALYKALDDIAWFRSYRFPRVSQLMGEVKMTVTVIAAGTQHNVVPAECRYVADIRPVDCYTNEEIVDIVRRNVASRVTPRSMHLKSSALPDDCILMRAVERLNITRYVSPTTSDISRIAVPALKMGPGESARSHTADEFIFVREIEEAVEIYSALLYEL